MAAFSCKLKVAALRQYNGRIIRGRLTYARSAGSRSLNQPVHLARESGAGGVRRLARRRARGALHSPSWAAALPGPDGVAELWPLSSAFRFENAPTVNGASRHPAAYRQGDSRQSANAICTAPEGQIARRRHEAGCPAMVRRGRGR